MVIGFDLDNTIVCYDTVFARLAREQGLIPPDMAANKQQVHDHLHQTGQLDEWADLQALAYGPQMTTAEPFPGVADCFLALQASQIPFHIVSRRTRHPISGKTYDLHESARNWLRSQPFIQADWVDTHAYFEETHTLKANRIKTLGCAYFTDDLAKFLTDPAFPATTTPIHFCSPGCTAMPGHHHITAWSDLQALLLAAAT